MISRPAHLCRDGFRCGAVDALRVAMRGIDDPHVWSGLDRIAENYNRDPDEYDLCGGGR
jgi:hypothetical protein